jgi:hypothetical protein
VSVFVLLHKSQAANQFITPITLLSNFNESKIAHIIGWMEEWNPTNALAVAPKVTIASSQPKKFMEQLLVLNPTMIVSGQYQSVQSLVDEYTRL